MEGAITITVTQAHCDELGHLNHVEAVRYLERARSDWSSTLVPSGNPRHSLSRHLVLPRVRC